jgi:RNA recognition motif-containing protein
VLRSNERRNRVANDPEITARSVYVTGLTWDTNDTELADHFRQAGVVVSSSILRQRRGSPAKSSLGCGVVEFASRDMALHACQVLNLTELKGRPIRCREDRHPDTDDRYRGDNDEDGGGDGDEDYGSGDLDDVGTSPAGSRRSGPPRDRHRPSRGPPAGGGPKVADPTRVFVTNLAWDATDADVRQHFSAIGPVASATVLSSRKGRRYCTAHTVLH